jgi:hypothetical protein
MMEGQAREGNIPSFEEQEIAYIRRLLKEIGGNGSVEAQISGIDRSPYGSSSKSTAWKTSRKAVIEAVKSDLR